MSALLRSALTAVTIVGISLLGLMPTRSAAAAPRCAGDCATLSARTTTPVAGARLTLAGTDFGGSDRITLTLHGALNPLGRVRTNASGAFRTTISLPTQVTGRHAIVASEPSTGEQAVQVLRISTAAGTSRAYTGVAVIGLGALCVVLLIGGGLLLLAGRRQVSA
jgi:hypothetical protein